MRELHRTVSVFLFHGEDVLLTKHPKYGGRWMGVGGHIEDGELAHEAAEREVLEEIGLSVRFPIKRRDARASELPIPISIISYQDGNRLDEDIIYMLEVDEETRNTELSGDQAHVSSWHGIYYTRGLKMFDDTREHLKHIERHMAANRAMAWRPM